MLVVKLSLQILWDYFKAKNLLQKAENGHRPISLYYFETLCHALKAPALLVGSEFCVGNVSENQLILLLFLALNFAPAQWCNFIHLHLIISFMYVFNQHIFPSNNLAHNTVSHSCSLQQVALIADLLRSQKEHITELKAKIAEVLAVMPHSAAAAAASATVAAGASASAGAIGAPGTTLGAIGKGSQQGNAGNTFAPFAPTTLSLDLPQVIM